jgi:hypothetical protein
MSTTRANLPPHLNQEQAACLKHYMSGECTYILESKSQKEFDILLANRGDDLLKFLMNEFSAASDCSTPEIAYNRVSNVIVDLEEIRTAISNLHTQSVKGLIMIQDHHSAAQQYRNSNHVSGFSLPGWGWENVGEDLFDRSLNDSKFYISARLLKDRIKISGKAPATLGFIKAITEIHSIELPQSDRQQIIEAVKEIETKICEYMLLTFGEVVTLVDDLVEEENDIATKSALETLGYKPIQFGGRYAVGTENGRGGLSAVYFTSEQGNCIVRHLAQNGLNSTLCPSDRPEKFVVVFELTENNSTSDLKVQEGPDLDSVDSRRFFKTTYRITVLSECLPASGLSLEDLNYEITDGKFSGTVTDDGGIELTANQMCQALNEQGSCLDFFNLEEVADDPSTTSANKQDQEWWAFADDRLVALGYCKDFHEASEKAPGQAHWLFDKEMLKAFSKQALAELKIAD